MQVAPVLVVSLKSVNNNIWLGDQVGFENLNTIPPKNSVIGDNKDPPKSEWYIRKVKKEFRPRLFSLVTNLSQRAGHAV